MYGVCACVWCVCSNYGSSVSPQSFGHCLKFPGYSGIQDGGIVNTSSVVCEAEVSRSLCPPGWAYYQDDGSEGQDSCLKLIPLPTTFTDALQYCPLGSHFLTVGASGNSTTLLQYAVSLNHYASFWMGCRIHPFTSAWAWMDGTPNNNLNCIGDACDLWQVPPLKCVRTNCPADYVSCCIAPAVCVCVSMQCVIA